MSEPYLDDEMRRRFSLQEPLSAAGNRIYDAADDGEAQGYAGIALDVEGGQVNVYWQGAIPATVVSAITAMRESVRVNLHTAPYSRAELQQDVEDIVADEERRAVPDEYRAHGLTVPPDGTGIVVEVETISPDEQRRRARRHVISTEAAIATTPARPVA